MNILMITNTYTPHVGGVARSVWGFTQAFKDRGHRVLVIAPEFEPKPIEESDVIRIPSIQNFNHSDFSIRAPLPLSISSRIDEFQPDIIHTHHPFMLGGTALVLAEGRNLPLVYTYHTMYEQYTHYVPGNLPRLKDFVVHLALGYANHCNHIIAPSQSIQSILKKRGLKRPSTVIPTGVDVARFASGDGLKLRKELGIGEKDLVVGHAGRLAPEKNLEFLTQAVAKFLKDKPLGHFLVVGEGPSRPKIQSIFAELNLSERIHFLGVTKGKRLVDAYHTMDVFAFASKTETQGMVLTEAMAAGVPVIALDAPGAREVVKDRINGRLLKDHALESFGSALDWFVELPESKQSNIRAKALLTANKFSMSRCADRCLKLYRTTMERKSKTYSLYAWEKAIRTCKSEWEILKNFVHAARKTWVKL